MVERTLTAMYDTRADAEAARDQLAGLGIPSGNISIRGTEAGAATTTARAEDKGFWESLKDLFVPDEDRYTYAEGLQRGGYLLSARVPEGLEDQATDVLERSGAVDLDERTKSWRQSGWRGYEGGVVTGGAATTGTAYATSGASAAEASSGYAAGERRADLSAGDVSTGVREGEEVIPVTEEELRIGKREVGRGGVRVRSYVTERPVEEQVNLRQERVAVERRPVDREVAPGDAPFQERTIEAVERGEEAVVDKRARVTEEIGLRKDVATETETVRDTVRKQEVEVEDDRTATGGSTVTGEERATTTRDRTAG